jgi:nicotinamidase-related amidase
MKALLVIDIQNGYFPDGKSEGLVLQRRIAKCQISPQR